jgi:glyoxylase-like metal-dependent hydrolase (beta-lactamase superfamily II)
MRKPTLCLVALLSGCGAPPQPEPPPPPPQAAPEPPPPPAPPPAPPVAAAPTAAASAAPAAEDKFAAVTIKVEKVAGNVYVLFGAGGNIGVSVGDDGIVVVDDQFAPLASKIQEALKGITDKRVRVVLNTHWHHDHVGGNAAMFTATGAPIVAHENVRKRMLAGMPAREVGATKIDAVPPAAPEALPIITFLSKLSVHLNGEEIQAIHLGTGHTDGDIVIHFTKSNVVHMGDDFVTYGFPFVDLNSGGSVKGLVAALDKITAELPADVKVIPGHGKVSTLEDVKKLSATLKDCIKIIEPLVKKKKTLAQIQEAKPLAKYDDMGKGFIKTDIFVETLFKELTKQPGVFVVH